MEADTSREIVSFAEPHEETGETDEQFIGRMMDGPEPEPAPKPTPEKASPKAEPEQVEEVKDEFDEDDLLEEYSQDEDDLLESEAEDAPEAEALGDEDGQSETEGSAKAEQPEDGPGKSQTGQPAGKLAGTFETVADLEKGFQEARGWATRVSQENAQLKQQIEAVRLAQAQAQAELPFEALAPDERQRFEAEADKLGITPEAVYYLEQREQRRWAEAESQRQEFQRQQAVAQLNEFISRPEFEANDAYIAEGLRQLNPDLNLLLNHGPQLVELFHVKAEHEKLRASLAERDKANIREGIRRAREGARRKRASVTQSSQVKATPRREAPAKRTAADDDMLSQLIAEAEANAGGMI